MRAYAAMRHPKKYLGLVLAGGLSRRMGQPKALCKPWGCNGPTMLQKAFELIGSVTADARVSCARNCLFPAYPCLEDSELFPVAGPCRGILRGLEFAAANDYAAIFALACDLPCMSAEILLELKKFYEAQNAAAVFFKSACTGKLEMLAGIYDIDLLPIISNGMAKGEASLFRLVPESYRKFILYGSEKADNFRNCNTPEDLAWLKSQNRF